MVRAGLLCPEQDRVLGDSAPFSAYLEVLFSMVSLQAAVMIEGACVTVWTCNHVTYLKHTRRQSPGGAVGQLDPKYLSITKL